MADFEAPVPAEGGRLGFDWAGSVILNALDGLPTFQGNGVAILFKIRVVSQCSCIYNYLMAFERCLYFNTRALARRLEDIWQKEFSSVGLSPQHGYLVRFVLQNPGLSQHEIGQALMLEKSTITRAIHRLVANGLVERRYNDSEGRERSIYPTTTAEGLAEDLGWLSDGLYRRVCDALGIEEAQSLVAIVRKARAQFEKSEAGTSVKI